MTEKRTKKHIFLKIVLALLAALVLSCVLSLVLSKWGLTTSHYQVSSEKLTGSFRVVSLADIHGTVFGRDNRRLVRRVAAEKPDLILLPGDLINKYDEDTSDEEALIRALAEIAPVYVSPGNHEKEYDAERGIEGTTQGAEVFDMGSFPKAGHYPEGSVLGRFEAAGATILNRSYVELTVRGQEIRLGGLYGYCMPEDVADGWMRDELPFLQEFQDTERYTMISCHMPFGFLVTKGLEKWNFDTVLSGHVHGGQIRFPFFEKLSKYPFGRGEEGFPYWGGFWAPDQGRFPGRLEGVYHSADGTRTLVLSRGLGSTETLPRFNNIPEIVVVDYGP